MRRDDCLYVDKTRYVYNLVSQEADSYFFIARPRRFGKSLLCSTLESLFSGEKELFRGLYIYDTDYDFRKYPVYHLDFSQVKSTNHEIFLSMFQQMLKDEAAKNGLNIEKMDPSEMITAIFRETEEEILIIVDEYDFPIIHTLHDKAVREPIREDLNSFYSIIKGNGEKIRLFFATGVTKFSNLSIFSGLNNTNDLTLNPNYSAFLGYTEEEVRSCFSDYIEKYLCGHPDTDREDFLENVRSYYDGYHFSWKNDEKVYNPVSVGFFFKNGCEFDYYWEETGNSTLAVTLAREFNLLPLISEGEEFYTQIIGTFDMSLIARHSVTREQVLTLLFYAGYLTIKEGSRFAVSLTFPNTEVRTSFTQSLILNYTENRLDVGRYAAKADRLVMKEDTASLIPLLQDYYEEFPYVLLEKDEESQVITERSIQLIFFGFFVSFGAKPIAEEPVLRGRSDIVFFSGDIVYIVELKVDESAEKALKQIHEKGYARKYLHKKRRVHLVGINFRSETRDISDWKEEILE